MTINTFKLEEYLASYEFTAPHLLCCSDAESVAMHELIDMASPADKDLWNNLCLGYTECKGMPALRSQIKDTLYPTLTVDNVLCFAGAEEGIFCALQTICATGDHVIVLTPCYQSLLEIPKHAGCTVTAVALVEENDWRIDIAAIKATIQPNTKCVVINFPHNPTGQVITQSELEALVQLCDQHGLWLFSDEVYRLLGKPSEPWAAPVAALYPKALSLGVMSKAYGMAGLRIGWIACQDVEMLNKIEKMKHYTSICNSAPAEVLSLIALKNSDRILARNNAITASNLALLDAFFDAHKDLFLWVRPQGGCVGFVKYNSPESVDVFCDRLVKQRGVLLMPASIYDTPTNHFRVGFGRTSMPAALEEFKLFL
eukprot:gene25451-33216_t